MINKYEGILAFIFIIIVIILILIYFSIFDINESVIFNDENIDKAYTLLTYTFIASIISIILVTISIILYWYEKTNNIAIKILLFSSFLASRFFLYSAFI